MKFLIKAAIFTVPVFASYSCSEALNSERSDSAPNSQYADAETASYGIASDEGCKNYFATGKDASFDVFDLSGSKHPLCSVLTEAVADYTFVVPYMSDCDSCVASAQALVTKIQAAGAGANIKVALLTVDKKTAESAKVDLGDLLVFSDNNKKVFPKLDALGYDQKFSSFYALGKEKGTLFSYGDNTDVAGILRSLGVKVDPSKSAVELMTEAFNLLVNWDGTSNLFDVDVVIEQQ